MGWRPAADCVHKDAAKLCDTPQSKEDRGAAVDVLRSLVDEITLVLENGELAITLRGDLGAILRFAAGKQNPGALSEAKALDNLLSQKSLVAGVGFEPTTFRL